MEFQHKLTETYSTSLTSSLSLSLKRIWLQKKSFEKLGKYFVPLKFNTKKIQKLVP